MEVETRSDERFLRCGWGRDGFPGAVLGCLEWNPRAARLVSMADTED